MLYAVAICYNRRKGTAEICSSSVDIGGKHAMEDELTIKMYALTIDCTDPQELTKFYAALLNWEVVPLGEDWGCVCAPGLKQGEYPGILFQRNPVYKRPVWPEEPEAQQQIAHIDFAVNDLERSVQHAVQCGARVADRQFSEDGRVMFDPAGHPFCLCQMKQIIEAPHFALR